MNILKRFVSDLGAQTAPFGFAPDDPEASYKAGLGYIGDIGANLLANNQGGVNPWANLGASMQQAKQSSVTRNKEAYTAQRLMEQAAAKKAEREAEAARQKQMEDAIAQLPPEQQALARMVPERFFGAQVEQMFQAPEAPQVFEVGDALVDASGNVIYKGQSAADLPAGVREYEYAKSQGFAGTFQDWEASKRGGMSLAVDPQTGAVTFQQGNMKPLTESQSKDTVYATRAEGALKAFEPVANEMTSLADKSLDLVPGGLGNYGKSSEYQKAEQAGREFLQAILRKDTGAAITAEEMREYGSVFLPKPGDGPDVLNQKKQSRRRAVEAIKAGMPAQAIVAQERALVSSTGQTPSANGSATVRYKYNAKTGELE